MTQKYADVLALSMAGHDKGTIYVVLGEENGFYLVADGRLRLLEKPKKKNSRHVQLIRRIPEEILREMAEIREDADIRRILKQYRRLHEAE